jgi:hypothetical protein
MSREELHASISTVIQAAILLAGVWYLIHL